MDEDVIWFKIEEALRPYIPDLDARRDAINDLTALYSAEAAYLESALNDVGLLAETMEANWRNTERQLAALHRSLALKAGAGA